MPEFQANRGNPLGVLLNAVLPRCLQILALSEANESSAPFKGRCQFKTENFAPFYYEQRFDAAVKNVFLSTFAEVLLVAACPVSYFYHPECQRGCVVAVTSILDQVTEVHAQSTAEKRSKSLERSFN